MSFSDVGTPKKSSPTSSTTSPPPAAVKKEPGSQEGSNGKGRDSTPAEICVVVGEGEGGTCRGRPPGRPAADGTFTFDTIKYAVPWKYIMLRVCKIILEPFGNRLFIYSHRNLDLFCPQLMEAPHHDLSVWGVGGAVLSSRFFSCHCACVILTKWSDTSIWLLFVHNFTLPGRGVQTWWFNVCTSLKNLEDNISFECSFESCVTTNPQKRCKNLKNTHIFWHISAL